MVTASPIGAGQREVEALAGAVAVHAGQQDLAGAERLDPSRPIDDVEAGRAPPAVGEHLPAAAPGARLASIAQTMHWAP